MKLEGIDPQHPSMYFILTVAEVSRGSHHRPDGVSQDRRMEPARGIRGLGSDEGDTLLPSENTQSSGGLGWLHQKTKNEQKPEEV